MHFWAWPSIAFLRTKLISFHFSSMQSFHSTTRAATLVASRKNQQTLFAAFAGTAAVGLSYSIVSTDKVNCRVAPVLHDQD